MTSIDPTHRLKSSAAERLKPQISIVAKDHSRLVTLADAAMATMPDVANWLADELERARIIQESPAPSSIVGMGDRVVFRDNTTGQKQTVLLVYPNEADISLRKISVLTPIGVALLGMSAGQAISWETRTGEVRDLTVMEIHTS